VTKLKNIMESKDLSGELQTLASAMKEANSIVLDLSEKHRELYNQHVTRLGSEDILLTKLKNIMKSQDLSGERLGDFTSLASAILQHGDYEELSDEKRALYDRLWKGLGEEKFLVLLDKFCEGEKKKCTAITKKSNETAELEYGCVPITEKIDKLELVCSECRSTKETTHIVPASSIPGITGKRTKIVEIRKNDAEGPILHACFPGTKARCIKAWMNEQSPNDRSPAKNQIYKAINGEGTIQARSSKGGTPEPIYHLKVRKDTEAFVVLPKLCSCRNSNGSNGQWKLVDTTQEYRTIYYVVLKQRHMNK